MSNTELIVSIHSLPHSDLSIDYPMFSWVLTDAHPTETPQRTGGKDAEILLSNEDALVLSSGEGSYNIKSRKDHSSTSLHVVRRLEFGNDRGLPEQKECEDDVQHFGKVSSPTGKIGTESLEQSTCSSGRLQKSSARKQSGGQYFIVNEQHLMTSNEKSGCNTFQESKELNFSPSNTQFVSEKTSTRKLPRTSFENISEACTSADRLLCSQKNSTQNLKTKCNLFESERALEYGKKVTARGKRGPVNKRFVQSSSACCSDNICRKSLLTRNLGTASRTYAASNVSSGSHKEEQTKVPSSERGNWDFNGKRGCGFDGSIGSFVQDKVKENQEISNVKTNTMCKEKNTFCEEKKFQNFFEGTPSSKVEQLEDEFLDNTLKKPWNVDKRGNVLHRTEKEVGDILPEVRHAVDQEYKKTLNERLSKRSLSYEGCSSTRGHCVVKRMIGNTKKTGNCKVRFK